MLANCPSCKAPVIDDNILKKLTMSNYIECPQCKQKLVLSIRAYVGPIYIVGLSCFALLWLFVLLLRIKEEGVMNPAQSVQVYIIGFFFPMVLAIGEASHFFAKTRRWNLLTSTNYTDGRAKIGDSELKASLKELESSLEKRLVPTLREKIRADEKESLKKELRKEDADGLYAQLREKEYQISGDKKKRKELQEQLETLRMSLDAEKAKCRELQSSKCEAEEKNAELVKVNRSFLLQDYYRVRGATKPEDAVRMSEKKMQYELTKLHASVHDHILQADTDALKTLRDESQKLLDVFFGEHLNELYVLCTTIEKGLYAIEVYERELNETLLKDPPEWLQDVLSSIDPTDLTDEYLRKVSFASYLHETVGGDIEKVALPGDE